MNKKRIGISRTKPKTSNDRYFAWMDADDVELVELSPEGGPEIESCDGFILTGGVDVDPDLYGGPSQYPNWEAPKRARDDFEARIYHYAQAQHLPLLAICRGMQLVNVLEGGKLIQDLGTDGNGAHRKEPGAPSDKYHGVEVQKGSLLAEITAGKGQINSAHHQAVDPSAVGRNLAPNALSGDLIEGLEFADKSGKGFMLCVQWHPERMTDKETSPFSANIKQRFLNEIRNHDRH